MKKLSTQLLFAVMIGVLLFGGASAFAATKTAYKAPQIKGVVYSHELQNQIQETMSNMVPEKLHINSTFEGSHANRPAKSGSNVLLEGGPKGLEIGSAWYDAQTNASMPRRISSFKVGENDYLFNIIAMSSAAGATGRQQFESGVFTPSYASLGSYYQLVDATVDPMEAAVDYKRTETSPSYVGSMFQNQDASIAVTSHRFPLQAVPAQIAYNESFDDSFEIDSIAGSVGFFPRACVDGKGYIHALINHRVTGEANFDEIGYKRSTDGGQTWDNELIFTGPNAFDNALPSAIGYDAYTIDASGDKVAIAWIDKNLNFIYRYSNDNGETWENASLLFAPQYEQVFTNVVGTQIMGHTDSVASPGGIVTAMVDANGNMHFACNVIITCRVGEMDYDDNDELFFIPGRDSSKNVGLFYPSWGFVYVNIPADPNAEATSTTLGPPSGSSVNLGDANAGLSPYRYVCREINDSCYSTITVSDAQFGMDDNGYLYFVYSTLCDSINVMLEPDVSNRMLKQGGQAFDIFNRHIYATRLNTFNMESGWEKPVNLTPYGWDCAYPSIAKEVIIKNGRTYMPIVYVAHQDPWTWISGHRIFNGMDSEPKVFFELLEYANYTTGVEENVEETVNLSVYPNPATDNITVNFDVASNSNVIVDVYSISGQKVIASASNSFAAGEQTLDINTSELANGAYIVKITMNGNTVTEKFSVQR